MKHPKYYNSSKIETWDWIELGLTFEEYKGYLKGNILKYLHRCEFKHDNPIADLDKAIAYIEQLKKVIKKGNKNEI